ncbi:FN3 associated domain-containing protein [Treponema sp.]|uniref:FN3 associated domain-containing protein n=1 Tax=Treponema sp. TaxID=166 RepID=UPI0025CD1CFB|nr:FN3 associated domain-containing protein [Treponema sp.]MCR5219119.1 chitobiase/beta-hexosaminidase C-terminal domain-containing protein [Treponema sp.]
MKKTAAIVTSLLFSLCLSSAAAFSSSDILSPAPGQWVNVQPLVINTSDGSEVYYSLTGSDPLVSGFSYDGPVVIDEIGDVKVRIAAVSKNGVRSDYTVNYSVRPSSFSTADSDTALLIQNINSNPILKYTPGSEFYIPEDFYYSLNNSPVMEKGRSLFINKSNILEHYAACTLSKGSLKWHFVIRIYEASSTEKLISRSIPFTIDNWTEFTYTGENLIYQIDDEFWTASRDKVYLDRSIPHTVRWQSIAYEEGNPVSEYIIPPEPLFTVKNNPDGSCQFLCSDTSYRFALNSDRLYQTIQADTFEGNTLERTCTLKVYCDNVYHGTVKADFYVDREKPLPPVFVSSAESAFARKEVNVKIKSEEEGCKIFYSVSEPVESDTGFEESSFPELSKYYSGTFKEYDDSVIVLQSPSRKAAYFKVSAWSKDKAGNVSPVSEYNVVVDQYNYYLRPSSESISSEHDGSWSNPFTTFEEALSVINSRKSTRLHVSGEINISRPLSVIEKDCSFICTNARFILPPQAAIKIKGANAEISGCIIERSDDSSRDGELPLISLENAELNLVNCELVGIYIGDGILIDSLSSKLNLSQTGLTLQSQSYACVLSASDSDLQVQDSRITSSAPNCVNFTIHGGILNAASNQFYLIGRSGHSLELASAAAYISGNTFNLQLDTKNSSEAYLWQDINTNIRSLSENTIINLN